MKLVPLIIILMVQQTIAGAQELPSDPKATTETQHLYRHMQLLAKKGFMIGHQDDLAYGVNWKYQDGMSDIKEVTGDYPAVYGWDLSGLEHPNGANNIDGVPFDKMREFIQQGYARGGLITISWHADNPLTGKNAWDTTLGTVASILPGGSKHDLYISWLDNVAAYLLSLKGKHGELIPVLFRPYHELTGNWFWWCKNNCTPEQFKTLWRFVNHYLREVKNVHNLLYVFNEADFRSKADFMRYYPGNDVVDIVSFDAYQYNDPTKDNSFVKQTGFKLSILDSVAAETHKVEALAESGYEQIPYANWWTETLLKMIDDHPVSYVLFWRNAGFVQSMGKMHYYVPYKGQVSEADFKKLYGLDKVFFEKKTAKERMYEK
ncbi:MAG TPA: glycosyl hydrolase [Chitinophagaceae bacterium]